VLGNRTAQNGSPFSAFLRSNGLGVKRSP
jgi:hypothetical protein